MDLFLDLPSNLIPSPYYFAQLSEVWGIANANLPLFLRLFSSFIPRVISTDVPERNTGETLLQKSSSSPGVFSPFPGASRSRRLIK